MGPQFGFLAATSGRFTGPGTTERTGRISRTGLDRCCPDHRRPRPGGNSAESGDV